MDCLTNIHFASASRENPLFFVTHREPANCYVAFSPVEAYNWLARRFEYYKNDPVAALDFEVTDFYRA